MKTPIADFVKKYAESDISRLHMPGHKGRELLGCERYDITEIDGADVLYSADGIIEESENNASSLFGTAHSFYSTEGSTLGIKAMLTLAAADRKDRASRPRFLAARNAHKAFVYACAMLDAEVEWLYPEKRDHICGAQVTAEQIECVLAKTAKPFAGVYLTSPDYLGNIADIEGIADVCHAHGVPLLVDNAHGAYLNFLTPSQHPIALGADAACDSAHKTLPTLTGGAYLHISKNAPASFVENARDALSLYASTSPSYLILQSLDLTNKYLSEGYRERLSECVAKVEKLKKSLSEKGLSIHDSEPLKLTVKASECGLDGTALAELLRQNRVEAEFSDRDLLVLMFTPENRDVDFARVEKAFENLQPSEKIVVTPTAATPKAAVMSIREAIFAPAETIPVADAEGRICAAPTVSCPPAVPIVMSGEPIDRDDIALFKRYGIDRVKVVK